jgi:predicted TIM-barrel fold metal-dependent hydrolase
MIIDAHTHIFSTDTVRYPLANPTSSYRPVTDGSGKLLKAQMDAAGVDRAVTIPPWFYGWDPSYVLDMLAENRAWLAGVALVDPWNPNAPHHLEWLVREHGFCGVRIQGMISGLGAFDDPATTPLWRKAADLGIPIDVNATFAEYPQVENRVREFPDTPILLDHCGYISSALAPTEPTVEPVIQMARYANVYAKLSFASIASQQPYPFADTFGMHRAILEAFGAERCVYGSNFPTVQYNPKMTYAQTVQLFSEAMPLSQTERRQILGETAAKLWRWGS